MNKNDELYTLIDKIIQYIPEDLLEDDNKTTTLSKIQVVSDRLKTGVYKVELDLDRVFYRLNNRFDS